MNKPEKTMNTIITTVKKFKRAWLPLFVLFITACSNETSIEKEISITLAAEMSLLPSIVWVAEKKGFFKQHNINLTIREFDSGRNALETMLKDPSIDIATVAQTPVVFNSFKKEPYVIFATMAYSLDDIKVLGRKDHGIGGPLDLKGKKIGATARSTGHYFLESFLNHYDFTMSDVMLTDINAAQLKDSLLTGKVDAITSWEPHISNAQKQFGKDKLTLMISPTPFRKDFYFTTGTTYAKTQSANLERFLQALLEAENYITENKAEAQTIVAERLGADLELIKKIWNTFSFELTLEQSILVNLEHEAIWAQKLTPDQLEIPNYLDFIALGPLTKIKPFGVNIIQ